MGFDLPVMNRLRRSGRALSPASLFVTGAQGAIYDPRDLTTMFQDSAGTTPVTAPGQPVGLRLDKSGRGNHATQATAGARLTYGIEPKTGTRNRLIQTEAFNEAIWYKAASNVVANSTNDPTGAATGDTVRLDAGTSLTIAALDLFTNSIPYVSQPTAVALTAGTYTYSVYVKGGVGLSHVQLRVGTTYQLNPSDAAVIVRLSDGALTGGSGGEAVSNAGGGWWRVSIPFTATAAIYHVGIWFWNSSSIASAVGTEGIYLWGAQLELGAVATPYQKVVTAFEVTEAGVPTCHYCAYAGANSMATAAIDFTATDKMSVFVGVRKLSDATTAALVEFSANIAINTGSFLVTAPNTTGASGDYGFYSRGSVTVGSSAKSAANPAPITSVISAFGNISADERKIRVNGTGEVVDTSDQGTGNYGNYPLYIGRRADSTLPFNGRDYGIVIVGKATSAAEINITEAWLAANTPTVVL